MLGRKLSILSDTLSTDYITLNRFVVYQQQKYPEATGELSQLLTNLLSAIKACSSAVRKAGFLDIYGLAGGINKTGDSQKKLDVLANQLMINMLRSSYTCGVLISEEDEKPTIVEPECRGSYIVAFDPLDGSSNIDCLGTIGTIFGIWKRLKPSSEDITADECLPNGRRMVCAGYALYGSATVVVIAMSGKVNCFMLDPSTGDFILIEKNMKIPEQGSMYSINEGYENYWPKGVQKFVRDKKCLKEPYKSRYVGSMVADIHRTIKYGGIFMYPDLVGKSKGKIRLLYEAFPIAYIIETAGGKASNGVIDILDIMPTTIHDTVPVYMGSVEEVGELIDLKKKHDDETDSSRL